MAITLRRGSRFQVSANLHRHIASAGESRPASSAAKLASFIWKIASFRCLTFVLINNQVGSESGVELGARSFTSADLGFTLVVFTLKEKLLNIYKILKFLQDFCALNLILKVQQNF